MYLIAPINWPLNPCNKSTNKVNSTLRLLISLTYSSLISEILNYIFSVYDSLRTECMQNINMIFDTSWLYVSYGSFLSGEIFR